MSFDVAIRATSVADMPLLERIDPRLVDDPARRAHIQDLLDLGRSLVATVAGEPAGYVVMSRHFFNFPFVDLLVVAPDRRRRGLGSMLMRACEGAHDADRIFTSTNRSNAPMRRLLEKAGWIESGEVDNLDEGDPEMFFVKFRAKG